MLDSTQSKCSGLSGLNLNESFILPNCKYTKWYWNIIEKRLREEPNDYYERHHIIPKFMGGGNEKNNLVKVTGREHYILHLLLMKICEKIADKNIYRKSVYSVLCFLGRNNKTERCIIPSKIIESIRIAANNHKKKSYIKENHPFWGKHLTEEHKKKLSISHIGEKNSFYGKYHSKESKSKMRIHKMRENHPLYGKRHSDESKVKMSNSHKGKIVSEESKIKISESHKGVNHYNFGKKLSNETKQKMKDNHWLNNGGIHPMLGNSHNIESIEKMRSHSTKQWWNVYSPSGEYFHQVSLNEMVRKYDLNVDCIRRFKGKIIPDISERVRNQTKQSRLNTTGWLFILSQSFS